MYNGDLLGSNKRRPHCGWSGRSCNVARQQVEAAQRPLWTLFIWGVMWVRFTRRRALGYNEDLSGLRLSRAHHAFLSECPVFDHACCLPHSAKQDGLRDVSFLFRRGS